jgi:hypothetical protein
MSDELEHRLRRDLTSLDALAVGDSRAIEVASDAAADRIARRRRRTLAGVSATVVAAGAVGLWAMRSDGDEVAMTDVSPEVTGTVATDQSSTTSPSSAASSTTTAASPTSATTSTGVWEQIAPNPRGAVLYPSVVWTGDEALVVGGRDLDGQPVPSAAAYSLDTDTWRMVADPPEVVERVNTLTVWTGSEMLVLGGDLPDGSLLVSYGRAYDPATDTWRETATPPGFVNARSPWAWTGTELYVWPWDGGGSTMRVTPLAYDPATDVWRELPEPPAERRQKAASVWTGTDWLVWGGTNAGGELADGVAYDASTDTWRVLAESPLSPRRVRAVWTGSEMIVHAGSSGGDPITGNGEFAHGDGAAYDPATDTWRTITPGPAHPGFEPVWTGSSVLMFAKGGVVVYDVANDRWVDSGDDDEGGVGGQPVWTGTVALIIGSTGPGVGGVTFTPTAAVTANPTTTTSTVDTELPGQVG